LLIVFKKIELIADHAAFYVQLAMIRNVLDSKIPSWRDRMVGSPITGGSA
jgi:hypothetical protein